MKSNDTLMFYFNVDVEFSTPLPCFSTNGTSTYYRGFIQEFGVTEASEEQAKKLVEERIKADFKLSFNKIRKIDFYWIGCISKDQLKSEILADKEIVESDSFGNPLKKGIWYFTGHGYYEQE